METLRANGSLKRQQMDEQTGFSVSRTTRILNGLLEKRMIIKTNSGPKQLISFPTGFSEDRQRKPAGTVCMISLDLFL